MNHVLVLDAMGVIYEIASLPGELLLPFISAHGGRADRVQIRNAYREASLGQLAPDDFWRSVGLDPALEDQCLAAHRPRDGLSSFLQTASALFDRLYVLSNDVSRWSFKTRTRHGLEGLFDGWLVSADLAVRKPDPASYQAVIEEAQLPPERILFVDDKPRNLDAASAFGMGTVLFGGDDRDDAPSKAHLSARDFGELAVICQEWIAISGVP